MNRILLVLSALSAVSGAAMLIFSVSLDCVNLLNAGLIALLISALLLIATVLTGHRAHTLCQAGSLPDKALRDAEDNYEKFS